jgi:hypothetical protein
MKWFCIANSSQANHAVFGFGDGGGEDAGELVNIFVEYSLKVVVSTRKRAVQGTSDFTFVKLNL